MTLCALTLFVAGCAGGDEDPQTEDDTSQTPEGCNTDSGESNGQSFGTVVCEEETGAGTASVGFDCPTPSQSQVRIGANLTAGSVTVTVQDAADAVVFETTLEGRDQNQSLIGEGEAGNWTITGETDADYEGTYGGQVACPTGEGGDETQTGCNAQTGQQQGQDVARIVCRGVEGADKTEQAFRCSTPSEASVNVQTQMSSGSVTVRLVDDNGSTVYEEQFSGETQEQVDVTGEAAGQWTLSGTRDADYAGDYGVQVSCPIEDS